MQILMLLTVLMCGTSVSSFDLSESQEVQVSGVGSKIVIEARDEQGHLSSGFCGQATLEGASVIKDGHRHPLTEVGPFDAGRLVLEHVVVADSLRVRSGDAFGEMNAPPSIPGWVSLVPPVLAIVLAIALRQAMIALFVGIWFGASALVGFNPLTGFIRTIDTHFVRALADPDHASILLFTLALGGMVGVLAKSGGTHALVDSVSKIATTRRRGMLATWLTGLFLFFDDYANCLLVGNTVRPLSDKLKISREKLAYLVDSTAAPITTVAVISTWVGYQLGLIKDLAASSGTTPYDLFIDMLPYSFYSLFTIAFVFLISATGRDFGPMRKAEIRAQSGQLIREGAQPLMDKDITELEPPAEGKRHWFLAVGPIVSVLAIVSIGLYVSGVSEVEEGAGLREIIAAANSYAVLLWAGFGGSMVAGFLSLVTRTMGVGELMESWLAGVKAMLVACLILVLAWTLGDLCKEHLMTGPWVLSMFNPSPVWIPALTFVVSALIALATGSSFSTMAIVIPITGAMAWALTGDGSGLSESVTLSIRYASLSAVLGGAVFGDHCSPISDTTIMSSMSSASDHIDHVRTQAPYAIVCGLAAIGIGYIPAGFGVSPLISLGVGALVLVAIVFVIGRPLPRKEA